MGGVVVGKISIVLKTLNALGGVVCILVGVFLARLGFIFIEQAPGSDSFLLVQAHWIAVGAISLLVSRIAVTTRFSAALLLTWLMLNGWVGGKAVLAWDPMFLWVLAFPIMSLLNVLQMFAQETGVAADEVVEETETHAANEPLAPSDFLSLDDVVGVELRCFLFNEGEDGERKPGVGYDIVFSNGMRGYLLEADLSGEFLDKVEAMDGELVKRGTPFRRAERAGRIILRDIEGYRPDCLETVLPKLDEAFRTRVGLLLRVDSGESAPIN